MTETTQPPRDESLRALAKRMLKTAGLLITLASLFFVGWTLYAIGSETLALLVQPAMLWLVLLAIAVLVPTTILLAIAWLALVQGYAGRRVLRVGEGIRIYATTQLYKYLPTNVLHMVGRFQAARRAGAPAPALALAQFLELALIALVAFTIGATLSTRFLMDQWSMHAPGSVSVGVVALILMLLAGLMGAAFLSEPLRKGMAKLPVAGIGAALLCYALFFLGNGLALVLLVHHLAPDQLAWSTIIGVGAIAWLVGFLIPGAPGGVGVREATLLLGLGVALAPEIALTVALVHRVASILAEVVVASASLLWPPPRPIASMES